MLLIIFVPIACVVMPILIPLNASGGRGPRYALEFTTPENPFGNSARANVTGLDVLAWTNVRPENTNRYWGHLLLAIGVVIWVCFVCFGELRVYIKVRQDYLTSAEHRLRASATTVLVSAIPSKWLTKEALAGLYDVFPGGVRNIWINRNFDDLLVKQEERNMIFNMLEEAETQLVRKCKKAQMKKAAKDEKYAQNKAKHLSKQEKRELADKEAERLANEDRGDGVDHQAPRNADDLMDEEEENERTHDNQLQIGKFKLPGFGKGLAVVGGGLGKGFGAVSKAGANVVGGARNVGREVDNQLETTNGFMDFDQLSVVSKSPMVNKDDDPAVTKSAHQPAPTDDSNTDLRQAKNFGNQTRLDNLETDGAFGSSMTKGDSWWKFWVPPAGGFASPIPTGYEGDEFPFSKSGDGRTSPSSTDEKRVSSKKDGLLTKIWLSLPFNKPEMAQPDYPIAYNTEYKEDELPAVWKEYIKPEDRPTHRLAMFTWTPHWFPAIPGINKKVDTIYWCRKELARLNMEIEIDQKEPERFPLMNSAFIQFNHQVAAHMACQAISHHVPRHMAPRTVEIAPSDVIWDNMSIKWWELWLRKGVVIVIVAGMVILWAFPVAWTSTLSNITALAQKYSWLEWLNQIPKRLLQAVSGVLPTIVLALLLVIVPKILTLLARLQGSQTATAQAGAVQNYYFAFLFVQVFLVVSLSSGAILALGSTAATVTSIPETLASQLPKAANYFFSYMILQALSVSSGTILQLLTLILWFILPPIFDNTARQKWRRNTNLASVTWGTYFPVYTNFACIGLIYSIVSPIITIFAIITFSLLWIANRYNMLYVSRFKLDTGGLLYPRAINQTFTGLYVMELCLIGLFFITQNGNGKPLLPQAIIMIIVLIFTIVYQVLLNSAFSPLFRYLPVTFEDEAVLRDRAFERAQARRLGYDDAIDDETTALTGDGDIPLKNLDSAADGKQDKKGNARGIRSIGTWAARTGANVRTKAFDSEAARRRRRRDIEANMKMSDALYGSYQDEIEDLSPEQRNALIKHAFKHAALRSRKPTIWIPKDDTGVSEDEIKRTRDFAGENIWIDNKGAALNGKCQVVYGKSPPDFSQADLITL